MVRDMRVRRQVLLLGAVALALAGCASTDEPQYRTASGLSSLPNETLQDWVSYSDAVVVVEIASDDGESPLSADELASGEGMTVRFVTAEVGEVVWAREDVGAGGVPSTFSVNAPGWMYAEGERFPYVMEDGHRLEVGDRYLMPIAAFDGQGWQPTTVGIPVGDDGVPELSTDDGGEPVGDPSAAAELSGLSIDAAAAKLSSAEPDPIAEAHADLDPAGRFREVTVARRAAEGPLTPAPGEK